MPARPFLYAKRPFLLKQLSKYNPVPLFKVSKKGKINRENTKSEKHEIFFSFSCFRPFVFS